MNINLSKGKSSIKKNWIRSNVEYFRALRFLLVHSSQYFPVVPSAACGEIWGKRYLCCICERYLFNKKSWYFELPCSETLLTICWKMRNIKFYSQHMFTWIQSTIWKTKSQGNFKPFSEIFLPGTFMLLPRLADDFATLLSSLMISRWQFDGTLLLLIRLIIG